MENERNAKITEMRIETVREFLRTILGGGNRTGEMSMRAMIIVTTANQKTLKLIDSMTLIQPNGEHGGWMWDGTQRDKLNAAIDKLEKGNHA